MIYPTYFFLELNDKNDIYLKQGKIYGLYSQNIELINK